MVLGVEPADPVVDGHAATACRAGWAGELAARDTATHSETRIRLTRLERMNYPGAAPLQPVCCTRSQVWRGPATKGFHLPPGSDTLHPSRDA